MNQPVRRRFYKKPNYQRNYRPLQKPKAEVNLGPMSDNEKKVLKYIKTGLGNRIFKKYIVGGKSWLGIHIRYLAPAISVTNSQARKGLLDLKKRKIIKLKYFRDRINSDNQRYSYEFLFQLNNRKPNQEKYSGMRSRRMRATR